MAKDAQFGKRLQGLLDQRLKGSIVAFCRQMRELGAHQVHASPATVRKWMQGHGEPPSYWYDMAGKILESSSAFIKHGESPADGRFLDGREEMKQKEMAQRLMPDEKKIEHVPRPREVWEARPEVVMAHAASSDSVEELEHIMDAEVRNPSEKGGRPEIIDACRERLEMLRN